MQKEKVDKKQFKKWREHDFKVNQEIPEGMKLVSVYVQKNGNPNGIIMPGIASFNRSSKVYYTYYNIVRDLTPDAGKKVFLQFRKQSDITPFENKRAAAYSELKKNGPNTNMVEKVDPLAKIERQWIIPFTSRYEPFQLNPFNPVTPEDAPDVLERNLYLIPEGMFIKIVDIDAFDF